MLFFVIVYAFLALGIVAALMLVVLRRIVVKRGLAPTDGWLIAMAYALAHALLSVVSATSASPAFGSRSIIPYLVLGAVVFLIIPIISIVENLKLIRKAEQKLYEKNAVVMTGALDSSGR